MHCRKCGKQPENDVRMDGRSGVPAAKQEKKRRGMAVVMIAAMLAVLLSGCLPASSPRVEDASNQLSTGETQEPQSTEPESSETSLLPIIETLVRPQLLHFSKDSEAVTPSLTHYTAEPGLTNVSNLEQFYLSDEQVRMLEENLFVVTDGWGHEFYELYEDNRYFQVPNFVTVDSLMHTYHLYFSLLLNRTEKVYLSGALQSLSGAMLECSQGQLDQLTGTEWEEAARRNVAFFAVAASLQDPSLVLPDSVADVAAPELEAIYAAGGIQESGLTGELMDYSQYKPRGYYEGDEVLERYFRTMMWYGQVNFSQKEESLNRSALLMTLAMEETGLAAWEKIYTVTTFFSGASDDLGYYEYAPAIEGAYGKLPTAAELVEDTAAYESFTTLAAQLKPPAINSVPVWDGTENIPEAVKGFRFMGQRFTVDAAVMQQLIYSNVGENSSEEKRMLPDALDVPAALGSERALQILTEQGETDYKGYSEQMASVRAALEEMPSDFWSASLYSSWLYTLEPLLTVKEEGYPSFMTGAQWQTKALETYAGSFTELKHDTVLYAKQVMAEMGGGPMEKIDDRGYVEPETETYRRFEQLARQTAEGLDTLGVLDAADMENLTRLAELARQLAAISEKELADQLLTDEEYELIRGYGGTLEHFWHEAVKDKSESEWVEPQEIPASLVTDVATDPNGTVLQLATGKPAQIYVIVPVDGQLRLASGVVYDFYQFEQPIDQRLTDTEWRQMIGEWMTDDGSYNWNNRVEKPWWTESYWCRQE